MPLGDRIRGRLRHVLYNPRQLLFSDNFEKGDFTKWTEYSIGAPYLTVVTTPVHEGIYAGKLYTNDINITPLLAKVLPQRTDTLHFNSFVRFIRMPTLTLFATVVLGRYTGAPFWSFTYKAIYLGVGKSGAKYYWTINDALTSTEVLADVWYDVKLLSSRSLATRKAWIDNVLIGEVTETPSTIDSVGYQVYPTNAPVDDGIYIDNVEVF